MNRTVAKYLGMFMVLFLGILAMELTKSKPIDWNDTSMSTQGKNPFGLYVLNQEIDSVLSKHTVHRIQDLTQRFSEKDSDSLFIRSAYIYIGYDQNSLWQQSDSFLNLAQKGHEIFLSSKNFRAPFLETLGLAHLQYITNIETDFAVWTTNENLSKGRFVLEKAFLNAAFTSSICGVSDLENSQIQTLGFQKTTQEDLPNFVRIPYGKGTIYLHSQPLAFSNYSLLNQNNHLYVENLLSYIKPKNVFWVIPDLDQNSAESGSLLRFILEKPALKWAWYLFLIGLVVFVIFTAKRTQRIIPSILPVENTTVVFTKTIASMFLQAKDYNAIIEKYIKYTLHELRSTYRIDTRVLDEHFIHTLHSKSELDQAAIENWVTLVLRYQNNQVNNPKEFLTQLNTATEKLWN